MTETRKERKVRCVDCDSSKTLVVAADRNEGKEIGGKDYEMRQDERVAMQD